MAGGSFAPGHDVQAARMRPRNFPGLNEKTRFMLALIAPAVLALVLFQVVPILSGANTSFRDWSLHDPKRTWVGLANYAHVLGDSEFVRLVLPNTFGFMAASVACSLVLGLLLALMLHRRWRGRGLRSEERRVGKEGRWRGWGA